MMSVYLIESDFNYAHWLCFFLTYELLIFKDGYRYCMETFVFHV